MKTMLLGLLLSTGAAQPAAPDATQWVRLGSNPDQSAGFYDPASLQRGEGTVRARIRAVPGPNPELPVRQFVGVIEVNCARRTTETISLRADFENGEAMDVPIDARPADPIHPNTPVSALYDIVCTAYRTN